MLAEDVIDPVLSDLALALTAGVQQGVAVDIGALLGHPEAQDQQHRKDRHADVPGLDHEPAPGVDGGDKVPVLGLLHGLGGKDEQAGHQGKDGDEAEADGLDEHQAQVKADAELHKHHGSQAGDRREAAGSDGRDGRGQGGDAGAAVVVRVLPVLQEAVEQNNGVVDGQGQLKDHGHGVGDKRDLSQQEIGAFVEQRRRAKGNEQHGDLCEGVGGQRQHQDDDDDGDGENDVHLAGQGVGLGVTHAAVDVHVIGGEDLFDLVHGIEADLVILFPGKGDVDEAVRSLEVFGDVLRCLRGVLVVAGGIGVGLHGVLAEGGAGHAVDAFDLVGQVRADIIGRVCDHDAGGAVSRQLVVHDGQAPARLGTGGEVIGQVVADLDPPAGNGAEDHGAEIEKEDQVAPVHDGGGQLFKKRRPVGFFAHRSTSCGVWECLVHSKKAFLSGYDGRGGQGKRQMPHCC